MKLSMMNHRKRIARTFGSVYEVFWSNSNITRIVVHLKSSLRISTTEKGTTQMGTTQIVCV